MNIVIVASDGSVHHAQGQTISKAICAAVAQGPELKTAKIEQLYTAEDFAPVVWGQSADIKPVTRKVQ